LLIRHFVHRLVRERRIAAASQADASTANSALQEALYEIEPRGANGYFEALVDSGKVKQLAAPPPPPPQDGVCSDTNVCTLSECI
jgi:hypothetical protein